MQEKLCEYTNVLPKQHNRSVMTNILLIVISFTVTKEVVSLGTGTKCIGQTLMSPNGVLLTWYYLYTPHTLYISVYHGAFKLLEKYHTESLSVSGLE